VYGESQFSVLVKALAARRQVDETHRAPKWFPTDFVRDKFVDRRKAWNGSDLSGVLSRSLGGTAWWV